MPNCLGSPPYPKSPNVGGFPKPYVMEPPPNYSETETVVVEQPCPINNNVSFIPGPSPAVILCPYCRKEITTRVDYKTGILTWVGCFGIFLVGGIFGCCLIPFCCDSCKDADHYCPLCNHYLGLYRRC
ncbi:Lipopolysaccharide-induced tumor necrosis factor-alpha factor like [Schistosoma japonicum]|nr:Lipopolysaccharide-induced tumor necrosis factor-alpha factor like [Schistosoma japonicum]KAH8867089.1 Lipopolysaccharide-induced tumor necrosis factor-alpha factor like [Schistosoma japonicum]